MSSDSAGVPGTVAQVRKFLVAAAGVLGQLVALGVLDGTALHWAQVVLAALTAVGVLLVPNAPAVPDEPPPTVV